MACVAIQVKTGQESIIAHKLKMATGLKVINPARKKITINNDGSISTGFCDLIKGYVLIEGKELTPELWHYVKKIFGVIRILEGYVTDAEQERIEKEIYPVIEVIDKTSIHNRKERVLRKTKIGDIVQRIRNNRVITTFPAKLLDKFIASTNGKLRGKLRHEISPIVIAKQLIRLLN